MKTFAFFLGFLMVGAGGGSNGNTSLLIVITVCSIGLAFMGWGTLPARPKNFRK